MAPDDRPTEQPRTAPIPEHRVTAISERISAGLVDADGLHPAVDDVRPVVEQTAGRLADAPVQDFVPLITEHRVRDALHDAGLRLDSQLPVDTITDPDDDPANG